MALTLKLWPSLAAASRLPGLNLIFVRQMGGRREKLYGSEEGHHTKNEVRKEKWIRKRCRKLMGADW